MPTAATRATADAVTFALRGLAWSIGLFGLLRLTWIEVHAVVPATQMQARLAVGLFGAPKLPIDVTLACSGADALALCAGAIFAYPTRWRTRTAGAVAGIALILGLNILRIGTLGQAVSSPTLFNALHFYVWPGLLAMVTAAYVFGWMRVAARPQQSEQKTVATSLLRDFPGPSRRFALFTAGLLVAFAAASPLYLESTWILALAAFIARSAVVILSAVGVTAHAEGNVLWTARGGFLVTQECISTPLIPIYLAAIGSYPATYRWRALGLLATIPIFTALGIARLLVVALPAAVVASPLFLVHAFYQLLLGATVVFLAACWRHGARAGGRYALYGLFVGIAVAYLFGPVLARVFTYPVNSSLQDPQGAVALLPAFQFGLYIALWIAAFVAAGWTRFLTGFAALGLAQTAGLLALQALTLYAGMAAQVRDIRAWAVAGPLLITAVVINVPRTRR